jgi:subtilisin
LLASLARGDDSLETGRYLMTFKQDALDAGIDSLKTQGLRTSDARDFENQALTLEAVTDADAVVFPEIGVALIGGGHLEERGMMLDAQADSSSPIETIEPEYFAFANDQPHLYLRGFLKAAETIAKDLERTGEAGYFEEEEAPEVLGVTWGLAACKVPPSARSGAGIRVAVLDTGFDLGHPDFVGRPVVSQTFAGQPVQDLYGHGTHCIGTALGPKGPVGTTPRYGIAYKGQIYVGKVLTNSGSGSSAGVLAGMNWAIANKCVVISMSLGSQSPVQAAYTAAGNAALSKGCLIVAAAGNAGSNTGAPANSPSIMAVTSLDPSLSPSSYSNYGKIELAAPGRDVFSSWPRPTRYKTISGTSMATPHVAGCAALWAETDPSLRGTALWNRLLRAARPLAFPPSRVGRGLVQAP